MHSCTEVGGQFCQIKKEQKLEKRQAERFLGSVRHPDLPVLLFQKKNGTMITDVEWIRGRCILLMFLLYRITSCYHGLVKIMLTTLRSKMKNVLWFKYNIYIVPSLTKLSKESVVSSGRQNATHGHQETLLEPT